MVDPLSKRWVDLLSDGKKEKRRQVGIQKDQKIDGYFVGTDQKMSFRRSRNTPKNRFPLQLHSPLAYDQIWSIPDSKKKKRRQAER